ncbi:helix-turn-helix domain-containing protein [Lachnoclostridium sp. MSJ-17]|uniref:helix-turn-helix domain-containing protein n=1 Tax=Lachnoclostridium sp. MSJ-17 TaxID=2841516 RepID=UPI001C0FE52F|nr:helix-turn-helix domain-containing protein [Lachnoclostridium sp. MSJ-17]
MNEDSEIFTDYPDILEIKDLQKMLSIGRNTALSLLSKQIIKNFRIGNKYKIPKQSVISYVNMQLD